MIIWFLKIVLTLAKRGKRKGHKSTKCKKRKDLKGNTQSFHSLNNFYKLNKFFISKTFTILHLKTTPYQNFLKTGLNRFWL